MASLSASRPPPSSVELQRWVLDNYTELRLLRASLHRAVTGEVLSDGGHLDDVLERVVVVATELATNAIRHGTPPTIVRLLRAGEQLIVDVADHDTTVFPEVAEGRPPGQGGLGLRFARELSLDIGWYATDATKHVWAAFPVHP